MKSLRAADRAQLIQVYFDTCVFFRALKQFKEAINDEDFEDLLLDAQADELELELMQSHMAQKPVLRGEVGCACVAREVSVERGGVLLCDPKGVVRFCHPFEGYDKAPAQVGDDDGPARVRGSGGDDGGGSGGGSDCAFLRRADHGGAS